ncbi:MAG: glycoside hydrolase family 3 N-terminal domain-containing protein [Niabella sp.]
MRINKIWILYCGVTVLCCSNGKVKEPPVYLDKNAPVEKRIDDLMKRMTLEEKIAQMCQYVGLEHIKKAEKNLSREDMKKSDAQGFYPGLHSSEIPRMVEQGMIGSFLHVLDVNEANYLQSLAQKSRLKIPLLIGIDAIHGSALVHGATVYPTPISLASTWDVELVKKISVETAAEMRATGSHWTFAPNLDLARDARWGRVGETFGEDPHLVSAMGVAMVEGLQQGDFTGQHKVLACGKHLLGGGEPVNGLNFAPAELSERTIRELLLPPFKAAVDAGMFTIMPAHNEVNRVPCHANRWLMQDVLRDEFGFKGFYVSDWMDIERLNTLHFVAETQKDACLLTVKAGMDMHMHGPGFLEPVLELVKEGKLSEARIDASVRKILEAKFRLGLFEKQQITARETRESLFRPAHQATALEAARKAIVLLKNNSHPSGGQGKLLPLKPGAYKNILITGPHANAQTILGDWALEQPDDQVVTVLEGIKAIDTKANILHYDFKWDINNTSYRQVNEAAAMARKTDLAIVVVGENSSRYSDRKQISGGENYDRDDLQLLSMQQELVEAIYKTGVPVIVVLTNGRPLATSWIAEHIPALIEAWEPGSFGGQAIAEVLYGQVNPSGKLPVSIPRNAGQIKSFYNYQPSQYFRKYVHSNTGNLYDFGYGLSYSSFQYDSAHISSPEITRGQNVTVSVNITNNAAVDGEEVVQLYINDQYSSVARPVRELKSFKRISLRAGETKQVDFVIKPDMLSFLDINMKKVTEPGTFVIMIGGSSRDQDLRKAELIVK